MTPAALLEGLRRQDIRVWAEGDRLHCDGPPGSLTPEVQAQLRAAKPALLAFLHAAEKLAAQQQALIPLTPQTSERGRPVLFGVGGHNGDVFCFRGLAKHLGAEQPFYGLQPPGADGRGEPMSSIEALADYFLEQVRAFQPHGPYHLVGYCAGGTIAFEMAQALCRAGEKVGLLALIGSPHPHQFRPLPKLRRRLRAQWRRVRKHAIGLGLGSWQSRRRYLEEALAQRKKRREEDDLATTDAALLARSRLEHVTLQALARYRLQPYAERLVIFLPGREWMARDGLAARWSTAAHRVEEHYGPVGCDGDNMLRDAHAAAFSEIFRCCLEAVPEAITEIETPPQHQAPAPQAETA